MKTILAVFGGWIAAMALLGTIGIGHFRLYYGHDAHGCANMERRLDKGGD